MGGIHLQFDEAQGKQISLDRHCQLPMDGYRVYGPHGFQREREGGPSTGTKKMFRLVRKVSR